MSILTAEESYDADRPRIGAFNLWFLFFAGVLLPAVTFFVELATRMCAEGLFDPMPTWWHALLVLFVPVTNFQTWAAILKGGSSRLGWLGFANAAAIFIALFYALIFAPVTPLAAVAAFFLVGFLPLAPLFSLTAAILMRRRLRMMRGETKPSALGWKGLAASFVFVFLALGLAELPLTLTKIGIQKANAATTDEQNAGLAFLRRYGDENYLLRLCYSGSGFVTTDVLSDFVTPDEWLEGKPKHGLTEQARKAYYRLTGKHYLQAAPPRGVKSWEWSGERDFADGVESPRINPGLSLAGSQMDGSVDGDAALGYLEWTLTFKNETGWQQEGLAEIQLPPGAVVSRLTLWINDEPREAAFAKSAKVIEAYNAVTATKRDPALVTSAGKDRVSLKCFPVPPRGEMKLRIGITTPLVLEDEASSLLLLPYFQTRNFSVPTAHAVWIESKKPLEIANPAFAQERRDAVFAVRGSVRDEDLTKIGSPVRAAKSSEVKTSWAKDVNDPQTLVRQEIRETARPKPERIVFVVDASARMKDFQAEIVEAIKTLAPDAETGLVLTGANGLNAEIAAPNRFVGTAEETAEKVAGAAFGGGTDGVSAIETAWELAQSSPNAAIVWIHAPQPVEITPPANLTQLWTRRPGIAPVYSLRIGQGKDSIDKVLNDSRIVTTVPRFGGLREDLSRLLIGLNKQKKVFEAARRVEKASTSAPAPDAKETSQHLVRLWANEEVLRLAADNQSEKAMDLAVKNQLVTLVSGAVVLETQEQYDRFGLKPVDANTVPTVPEPEEYFLFGVVLAILAWFGWRFRNQKLQTV